MIRWMFVPWQVPAQKFLLATCVALKDVVPMCFHIWSILAAINSCRNHLKSPFFSNHHQKKQHEFHNSQHVLAKNRQDLPRFPPWNLSKIGSRRSQLGSPTGPLPPCPGRWPLDRDARPAWGSASLVNIQNAIEKWCFNGIYDGDSMGFNGIYDGIPSGYVKIAIENGHWWWIYLVKMVMCHSSVWFSLEGGAPKIAFSCLISVALW